MSILKNNPHKPVILWLLSGCFLIFLMVIIGGITRLTHSGLSITEWNLLMGTLPPLSEAQWNDLFEKYQQSPEFKKVHYFFTLAEFKSIFWWEYTHRLLGRLTGIVFVIPFLYFLLKKKISPALLPKLILIFLLGALQGFLGWYMVKSGLVDIPAVSHYRLAAHLFTAFITFGYTFWVALDLLFYNSLNNDSSAYKTLKYLSVALIILIVIQIIFGAFVAGLKAGYAYPTFPRMGTQWIADEIKLFFAEDGWITFIKDGASVQFVHRWIGIAILLFSVALWFFYRKKNLTLRFNLALRTMLIVVLLQFTLGLLTLLNSVPLDLAVLHQAGAFVLFGSGLYLTFTLK